MPEWKPLTRNADLESWVLRATPRLRAIVISRPGEPVAWTVGRRGEFTLWRECTSVERAKRLAELTLEDTPDEGPLDDL